MFQSLLVGNLGGDAVYHSENGREFVTFRVAHNERWQDADGAKHESTMWVDCVMNGHPSVTSFLKAGQQVLIQGSTSVRIYDSAVDRCKKATARISVQRVELLGAAGDKVPSTLYDDNGVAHPVTKYFHTDVSCLKLRSGRGDVFVADDNGWVVPYTETPAEVRKQLNSNANE